MFPSFRQEDGRWTVQGDPTEGALIVAARKVGLTDEALGGRFARVGEIPFSSERKLMTTAHLDAQAESAAPPEEPEPPAAISAHAGAAPSGGGAGCATPGSTSSR